MEGGFKTFYKRTGTGLDTGVLRAGYAEEEITPGPGMSLIGYEFRDGELPPGNGGVHDPLWVRVLVLESGRTLCFWVTLDLCILTREVAVDLRRRLAVLAGGHEDRILLSCSHTHSGPFPQMGRVSGREEELRPLDDATPPDEMEAYTRLLFERVEMAARRARGLLNPVVAEVQEAPLGIGYNRRVRRGKGVAVCWNPQEFPNLHPEGAPDPTLTTLRFRHERGPNSYVLWSLGVHPVCLGKTSRVVSADWPGVANRMIREADPDCRPLFVQGAGGEVHPWIATQNDPDLLEVVARPAAALVRLLGYAAVPMGRSPQIRTLRKEVRVGTQGVDVTLWRIGDLLVVGLPVELFGTLSMAFRQRWDGPVVFATLTNGWECYWPNRGAFAEGNYEVDAARSFGRRAGDGEELMKSVERLARGLFRTDRK